MADVNHQQATVDQLQALAHPLRWRVLRMCREAALTNQELADRLDVAPPTMLRHIRILTEQGFLAAEPVRRGPGGGTERPYRATGLTLNLSINDAEPSALRQDVDLAVLDAHRAELVDAGPGATVDSARGILHLDDASLQELTHRIEALLDEYRQRGEPQRDGLSFLWSLAQLHGPGRAAEHQPIARGTQPAVVPDASGRDRPVVVVTGASGGIGAAVTRVFAERGARVLAIARPSSRLDRLCAELPSVVPIPIDLRTGELTVDRLGSPDRVDVIVHCAAIAEVAAIADTSFDLWRETLTINVVAAAELTRMLLPALRAAGGHVVFVNASPGLRAVPRWSAYVSSKAALRELADSLREEESEHGVRVTTVYPGGVGTELLRRVRAQFGREYEPENTLDPSSLAGIVATIVDLGDDAHITEVSLRQSPRSRRSGSAE